MPVKGKQQTEYVGELIQVKITLHNYRYPKSGPITPGQYAIVICNVKDIIEGVIADSSYLDKDDKTIVVTGCLPKLEKEVEYLMTGKLVVDKKWGAQYQSLEIHMDYDLKDPIEQKKFMSVFLTPAQLESLYSVHENPFNFVKERNIKALMQAKGIGACTAQRICDKFDQNKSNSRVYVELDEYGLSKSVIDNIVSKVGSPETAIDMIKNNPYSLIKYVSGYGWERADKIALATGFQRDSKERCLAYGYYKLEKIANDEGNSRVEIESFLTDVFNVCQPATQKQVSEWIKSDMIEVEDFEREYMESRKQGRNPKFPSFFYDREAKSIALSRLRTVERRIKDELLRLNSAKTVAENRQVFNKEVCESIIEKVEEHNGWKYTHEQKKAIWDILDNNVSILTGSAGCVDCDTEFFTGTEWKKISEYQPGDKVLVYHENGSASLEAPERYIKQPAEYLWLTQTKYGLDMCLSGNHNVYYVTSKGNLYHKTFAEIIESHNKTQNGFSGKFITSFSYNGPGIDLTDAQIKLMLAVIADGSFAETSKNCRFHIKKDRKKAELRAIMTECGIEWRERDSVADGFTDFYCEPPRREKAFGPYWYGCSQKQLQVIVDNILKWDGSQCQNRKAFSTNDKQSADFVQYAFSACGYRSTISVIDRVGETYFTGSKEYERKSVEYKVLITGRNLITMLSSASTKERKAQITPYKTLDGFEYCFTVSTHMWVMRRNNKIVITGNCGKSSTVRPLIEIFKHYNMSVDQCALSGRAASLLTEYTGVVGKTIHRLLGYIPEEERFHHNYKNQLDSQVIILDESSMVGEELFYDLLQSIKSGSKLIMLGDVRQLPPISVGNILSDCMRSGYISTNTLTIIHRQAMKSGIVSQASAVCKGEAIIKQNFVGSELRGELQDFKLMTHVEPLIVHKYVLDEFKRLYESGIDIDDIQIVVPVRAKGNNSCRMFNAEIQRMVNDDLHNPGITVTVLDNGSTFNVTYRRNDRIIIMKNNYHAKTITGKEAAIFNGNMGRIVDIDNDNMIISLSGYDENIVISRDKWKDLSHSYAVTAHKCQGSQAPYVIIGLDNSSFPLLIREWLYTAITRAKKYCVLVGQPQAICTCTRTSNIKIKKTWLCNDLKELYNSLCDSF